MITSHEEHSGGNIKTDSIQDIGKYIANHVKNNSSQELARVDSGNNFDDHTEHCLGLLEDLGIHDRVHTWSSYNYESPNQSSPVSTKSAGSTEWSPFSDYNDTYGFRKDDDEDEDENIYKNYFDWDSNSKKPVDIIDTLNNIHDFKRQVLGSINKQYLAVPIMYMCRINVPQEDMYFYIIGFTRNIENALETIDDAYACEWKMEILALLESKSQNDEIRIKYNILQMGIDIDNNLYNVDHRIHDFITTEAIYVNPFYDINKKNEEMYLGEKITTQNHTSEHID